MRALLAAGLAAFLVASAALPHVHADGPRGAEHCVVCVVRAAAVPSAAGPDVRPAPTAATDAVPSPVGSPVCGAPLGAIPGQSPPA